MTSNPSSSGITPVFFGRDSGLYGCFQLSENAPDSPALLICQSVGHEYERCHRAMRQLSLQAAKKGYSSMRFDYYASGDSKGESEELSLAGMRLDIEQAIDYWRDRTSSEHITLAGIRLGATLAAQVAANHDCIDSLVLYAPVLDGRLLLQDWQRDRQTFMGKHSNLTRKLDERDMLGFPLSDKLVSELEQNFTCNTPGNTLRRVLILVDASETESVLLRQWVDVLAAAGAAVAVESIEDIAIWRREPMESIVPVRAIRRILGWAAEAARD